eukprot:CAMPEP_0176206432 /NCGR_PEP_ID=MMETSP0121_2-20121125/12103_1 /TAXON_ID=160619 /ORGANISM="Kryptoperidinium foliaceum, Strain CCMP 1326" /LENGTH=613 /DNA_ID=CAMNT_0017545389 /DNA_START=29 /DNA_END=1870 /DNA_ORIENTATION=-
MGPRGGAGAELGAPRGEMPHLASGDAASSLHLRSCDADGEGQHFEIDRSGPGALLRLKASPGTCVGVDGEGAERGKRLTRADCDTGGEALRFELPERGQGPIRWAPQRNLCLTVQGPAAVEDEEFDSGAEGARMVFQVALEPCEEGLQSQAFLAPRDLGGSAFVGVNLGGWLLLEEWMWPGEMSHKGIHDEWSLIAKYGGPEDPRAQKIMHRHWENFLREEHLDQLARFGITHVRVPVGYWLMGSVYNVSDGFVDGGEVYLRRLMRWLKQRRMKAVLDLHALPGGQAVDGFTGRRYDQATFFLESAHFERGKRAAEALADLILDYEAQPSSSGVVVGIELLNEPLHDFWDAPMGIRAFYEEMVPWVRQKLPAEKYMVLLSFMDSPHTPTADWLAEARSKDPVSFAGVVYDLHLYHLFGDNTAPWTPGQDHCKTCCRDPHLIKPMFSKSVPSIIGEYALSTGFAGWEEDGFARTHLENQWSLFNTTEAVVGSFQWNFRLLLPDEKLDMYKEWSLLDLINSGYLPPDGVYGSDLSARCPQLGDRVGSECPSFENMTVIWTSRCEWQLRANASASAPGRTLSAEEAESIVELAVARRSCGLEWFALVASLLLGVRV